MDILSNKVQGLNGKNENVAQSIYGDARINPSFCILPMDWFLNSWKSRTDYISFPNFDNIKKAVLEKDRIILRFLGLSGLGKSRLIYEIFNSLDNDNNFYCPNASDNRIQNDLNVILSENQNVTGYIVLDNCDTTSFIKIVSVVQNLVTQFKIIAIYNDPLENAGSYGVNVITLHRDDLKEAVDKYIDNKLQQISCDDSFVHEQIRNISDGFPQIAIRAIEEYYKQGNPQLIRDAVLWQKMCGDTLNNEQNNIALRSLALFDPLGYKDQFKEDYNLIKYNEDITPLYDINEKHKDNIFSDVVRSLLNRELIEQDSSWIVIRPLPLAVWLVGQWFEKCDDERFVRVVQDLDSLPDNHQSTRMKRAFCKRIQYMQENKSAIEMFNKLMGKEGPFRNEKVVSSDFGSQLFLASSTVNHVAVTSCLYSVISKESTDWLKNNIIDNVRRNLVWCLEHLCFPKDSFEKAAWILAKLAMAENETWGNNATGNFLQLFHIVLPGTNADLKERFKIIKRLFDTGNEALSLLLKVLERAFDNGSFTRNGGGEKFGYKSYSDFMPSGSDVKEYWNQCRTIIQQILEKYPQSIDDIKRIVLNHVYQLGPISGCWDLLSGLIKDILKVSEGPWPEMSKELSSLVIDKESLPKGIKEKITALAESISDHSIKTTLENARYKFYNEEKHRDFNERLQHAEEYWKEYANKFISLKLYEDSEIISQLMDYSEIDYIFTKVLANSMNSDQLAIMIAKLKELIFRKPSDYTSTFTDILITSINNKNSIFDYSKYLLCIKHFVNYVGIISQFETLDLNILKKVLQVIRENQLEVNKYLVIYLNRAPLHDAQQMFNICNVINSSLQDTSDLLLYYVLSKRYIGLIFNPPMYDTAIKLIKGYKPNDNKLFDLRDLSRLVDDIIQDKNDSDFVKTFNHKIINGTKDIVNFRKYRNLYERHYSYMLPKYQGAILNDVLDALSDNDSPYWFFFQDELGCGSGIGEGPLFKCNIKVLKERCLKDENGNLTVHLAHMCPVYKYATNENCYEDKFSDFFYWIVENIDKFKDPKAVLDSFHANMNTYFWTGSVLPLLRRKERALINLKDSTTSSLVIQWIDCSLKSVEDDISRESKNEAYQRLAD